MARGLPSQTAATQWTSSAAQDTNLIRQVIGVFWAFMNERNDSLPGNRGNAGSRAGPTWAETAGRSSFEE